MVFRGEERVVKIHLAGLMKYLQVGKDNTEHPHVIVPCLAESREKLEKDTI